MNTNKEKEDFQKHLESIANDITNGIKITKEDLDYNGEYEIGDTLSGYDYLTDALDIEYTVNSDKTYKGARVLVSFGGPNIWINTLTEEIEGYWWGMNAKAPYYGDSMDLNECLEEIYNNQ